jgi:hypothetical protein
MAWPYPDEHQDPWYDAFVGLMTAMDFSGYAAREDRNIVLMGGGTIAFDAALNTLTWSAPLYLLAPITGFLWAIPAGSVTLFDGRLLYTDLVRAPQAPTTLAGVVANQVPSSDTAFLLAVRRGTRVFWRNGAVSIDGIPGAVIDDGGPSGGGGGSTPAFDKYLGDGLTTVFPLTNLVSVLRHPGVLVYRNGLLLDQTVAPATVDEYSVGNVGLVTNVTFGFAPSGTDRIFITYGY